VECAVWRPRHQLSFTIFNIHIAGNTYSLSTREPHLFYNVVWYLGLKRLGNSTIESLSLEGGNLELKSRRLSRTICSSESTSTPWATCTTKSATNIAISVTTTHTTVNFSQVAQLREGKSVTKRDEDYTVVSQSTQGIHHGNLLSSTRRCSRDENTSVFSCKSTFCPQRTSAIPERLKEGWNRELFERVVNLPSTARGNCRI
jgi:hypothetical protein